MLPGHSKYSNDQQACRRWDVINQGACGFLAVVGVTLLATARSALDGDSAVHGQVLGLLMVCMAALGCPRMAPSPAQARGGTSGRLAMRVLVVVGIFATALSTTGLLEQAGSDVTTQCMLAEAAVRIRHLEERVTALKHDELITQLFFRMNEVDDILDQVHSGAGSHAELKTQQLSLEHQDRDYIRAKVGRLRKHAESVAQNLKAEAAQMVAAQGQASIPGSSERVAANEAELHLQRTAQLALGALERRLEGVQQVVSYMDSKDAGEGELTFEEYEIILDALTSTMSAATLGGPAIVPPGLDNTHLTALKAAFERKQRGAYHEHLSPSDPHALQLQAVAERRDRARRDFEVRFMSTLEGHGAPTRPSGFYKGLSDARLEALPEHCLRHAGGHRAMRAALLAALGAQAAAAFAALMAASQHLAAVARRFD